MKKRIWISAGVLILLIIAVTVGFLLRERKVEVTAASVIFSGHPYHVYLTQSVDLQAIREGKVYVTDEKGNKLDAAISLNDNQRTITIEDLSMGKYILHIDKKAFKRAASKTTFEFQVIEKLESVQSVEELEKYFEAALAIRKQNDQKFEMEDGVVEESAADTSGSDHSTTNNQVEGIDEGDIVITDGKYIYTAVNQKINIVDAQDPKNLRHVATIQLKNSYPQLLLKEGNYLIALLDEMVLNSKDNKENYIWQSFTKAAIYDVSDASNPKLAKEFGQEGYMNGVRKYNGVLYMVSGYSPNYWFMEEREVELRPYISDGGETTPLEIENISIIPGSLEPSYTIISAIDLNNLTSKEVITKGYLGSSSALYMSPNALYLTAFDYGEGAPMPIDLNITVSDGDTPVSSGQTADQKTNIYKFIISGTNIEFAASESVKGHVLNQFSMDEHNGYFRIATTEGVAWGSQPTSKNHLFILNGNLEKVGEVTDLAKGERIYSVRFMGDKAYIVTFKETDPLFVIDTSDPGNPTVLGELKIPGFSNYLHPLGDHHLIGIGYDTEQRMDSWSKEPVTVTTGMKISLFDVSDFANPKEQDTAVIGGRGTYSEAQYNHKAFFRNEELNYYGFPVILYEDGKKDEIQYKGLGAVIYEITPERGIQLKGDIITPAKTGELYEDWNTSILRLAYIGDVLYTVSPNEVKSYDINTFNQIGQVGIHN
ncbi:beta-propeller domain-containing protein [Ureibacillus sp. FSL K6-3587]|uniref:beta-propeller domain-containing protein n=1 Tax=Ureibacillus sp. FSL K6-3587 TaxID=2954681 RepID=UPI003158917D